jgi:hypothetical protein
MMQPERNPGMQKGIGSDRIAFALNGWTKNEVTSEVPSGINYFRPIFQA